jgi:hypothetical protein
MNTETSPALADPGALADLKLFQDFIRDCEELGLCTGNQLKWWCRYRAKNGLTKCGAVIEKRVDPKSKRPLLVVDVPLFTRWLKTNSERPGE